MSPGFNSLDRLIVCFKTIAHNLLSKPFSCADLLFADELLIVIIRQYIM